MSLPRHLQNEWNEMMSENFDKDLVGYVAFFYMHGFNQLRRLNYTGHGNNIRHELVDNTLYSWTKKDKFNGNDLYSRFLNIAKFGFKIYSCNGYYAGTFKSNLEIECRLHIKNKVDEYANNSYSFLHNLLPIKQCFETLAQQYYEAKEKKRFEQYKKDERRRKIESALKKFENKVYEQRTFPPTLSTLIFYRDKHTCQNCLRDKDKLMAMGLHLEADHMIPWKDGGKTTLTNAQTLCSECNKAKHHAEKYLELIN